MNVPILKNEARLSDVPSVTHAVKRNRHLPAIVVGYVTMAALAISLLVAVFVTVSAFRGGPAPGGVPLPFQVRDGMSGSDVLALVDGPYNFQGDGTTYGAWRIIGNPDELRRTINNDIRDGLVWRRDLSEQDRQIVSFVSGDGGQRWAEYQKVRPYVDDVLADDCYIAYFRLRTYPEQMMGASIWLFSPKKMLLVYLSAST